MRNTWLLRALATALFVLVTGWIVHKTSWVDVEEKTPPKGEAVKPYYSLRRVASAAGATLVERTALEPMPPRDATLFLESRFWDLFPERDAKIKAWVEAGGHLVVFPQQVARTDLRWIPPLFVHVQHGAKPPAKAASSDDDADDDDGDAPVAPPTPARTREPIANPHRVPFAPQSADLQPEVCESFTEQAGSTAAFEPGRVYRRCLRPASRFACVDKTTKPNPHLQPLWTLGNDERPFALTIGIGRGTVTGLAECLPINNDAVLSGDHALIDAAVLGLRPGATLWIVDDEAGEPLAKWLWHHARAPLMLTIAAIALALWRLMARFGPREAAQAHARRSMGEQVRGTGEFIAGNDPAALHAATRKAFDDAARARIEAWAELDDEARVAAIAALLAPAVTLDSAALLAALSSAPRPTQARWLAAIETIEHARRALLRAAASPRF